MAETLRCHNNGSPQAQPGTETDFSKTEFEIIKDRVACREKNDGIFYDTVCGIAGNTDCISDALAKAMNINHLVLDLDHGSVPQAKQTLGSLNSPMRVVVILGQVTDITGLIPAIDYLTETQKLTVPLVIAERCDNLAFASMLRARGINLAQTWRLQNQT